MPDPRVVTRFAPSPTGQLHVGGARTALFNWAFARGRGGQFLLRLEDTDQARSTEQASHDILEDLKWIGLDWDNADNVPRQSQRLALYDANVDKLLADGQAFEDENAIRFRMPDHPITINDCVLGDVRVEPGQVEDFIIRKSDGFATYHLAVVTDDAEMGVTHVIRGQEHLNNAIKHAALQDALNLQRPEYAHIPLIFNPDNSKMSKRDKAKAARVAALDYLTGGHSVEQLAADTGIDTSALQLFIDKKSDDIVIAGLIASCLNITLPEIEVADFRRAGYLPEALCNYLALLGWNPGNDLEQFDNTLLAEQFSFDRVGKSNSKFDRDKLFRFNADRIKTMPPQEFCERFKMFCEQYQTDFITSFSDEAFSQVAQVYHPRSRTLAEPCELAQFLICSDEDLFFDSKAVAKVLEKNEGEGYTHLAVFLPILDGLAGESFGTAAHDSIKEYAEQNGIGMGKIAQPLRVAISGSTVTPQLDATFDLLGKQRTLNRIIRCLQMQEAKQT